MQIESLDHPTASSLRGGTPFQAPTAVQALVYNTYDAGATRIQVRLDRLDSHYIEVEDNGFGIEKKDLEEISKLYSTSKIRDLEEIQRSKTLGFRGRDLATLLDQADSIEITTCCHDSHVPLILRLQDKSRKIENSRVGRLRGTAVKINCLFAGRPALASNRRADQETDIDIVTRLSAIALARPGLKLHFFRAKKSI